MLKEVKSNSCFMLEPDGCFQEQLTLSFWSVRLALSLLDTWIWMGSDVAEQRPKIEELCFFFICFCCTVFFFNSSSI